MGNEERLSRGLGWFSLGLGIAQLAAPRSVARFIGVPDTDENETLMRMVGLREIASGVGILTQPRPTEWLWARVGGDAMDIALLNTALKADAARQDRVAATTLAVAGVTALDVYCSQQMSRKPDGIEGRMREKQGIEVKKTITINRSPEELYRYWRNFENLPRFMNHLESVQVMDDGRSHWKAKAPAGATVEWDAEIIEDRPTEMIAWRSLEGAEVDNSGSVRFEPATGGRGTVVRVEMRSNPPGGAIGAAIAKLFGEEPEQQISEDLRRFKQMMETGEVVLSDATVEGAGLRQRPAQPPEMAPPPPTVVTPV